MKTYKQYIGTVPLDHYDTGNERYAKEQSRASESPEMNSKESRKRTRDDSLEDGEGDAFSSVLESLRNTTRLLMTSQRSLETSAIFRFAPMLAKGWRDRARF